MADITLPKGKTAILVMDCQNDIVHEEGKVGGSLTGGTMPRVIKERNILGTIRKLMEAGRAARGFWVEPYMPVAIKAITRDRSPVGTHRATVL